MKNSTLLQWCDLILWYLPTPIYHIDIVTQFLEFQNFTPYHICYYSLLTFTTLGKCNLIFTQVDHVFSVKRYLDIMRSDCVIDIEYVVTILLAIYFHLEKKVEEKDLFLWTSKYKYWHHYYPSYGTHQSIQSLYNVYYSLYIM